MYCPESSCHSNLVWIYSQLAEKLTSPPSKITFSEQIVIQSDNRLGNYKVFKTGCVFLFIASVMACLHVLVITNVPDNNNNFLLVISVVMIIVLSFLCSGGLLVCYITSLQLGLDQMPDGSTANITSFIS